MRSWNDAHKEIQDNGHHGDRSHGELEEHYKAVIHDEIRNDVE